MEFDLEDPLSTFCAHQEGEEVVDQHHVAGRRVGSVSALFSAESDHMPPCKNLVLDLPLRRDAASLLLQAQFSCNLDPFIVYLAINYVDRFLSRHEIPSEKPWIVWALSIACLSLASKMKKVHFSVEDFQMEGMGFVFDARTIHRMELLVLGALGWRMRSITPFSFLQYFLSFFRTTNDPPLLSSLKARAIQIIFKAQNEMKMLEFKASVIAASSLLTALHELFPFQFPSFLNSILSSPYVKKKEVVECCGLMGHEMRSGCDHSSLSSSCNTPVTVLGRHHHRHCSISESDRTTVGCSEEDAAMKRVRF